MQQKQTQSGKDLGTGNPTLDYWSYIYATTQSKALKQKAAIILGIKEERRNEDYF